MEKNKINFEDKFIICTSDNKENRNHFLGFESDCLFYTMKDFAKLISELESDASNGKNFKKVIRQKTEIVVIMRNALDADELRKEIWLEDSTTRQRVPIDYFLVGEFASKSVKERNNFLE